MISRNGWFRYALWPNPRTLHSWSWIKKWISCESWDRELQDGKDQNFTRPLLPRHLAGFVNFNSRSEKSLWPKVCTKTPDIVIIFNKNHFSSSIWTVKHFPGPIWNITGPEFSCVNFYSDTSLLYIHDLVELWTPSQCVIKTHMLSLWLYPIIGRHGAPYRLVQELKSSILLTFNRFCNKS